MMKYSDDVAIQYGNDISVEELKNITGIFGFSKKFTRENDGFPSEIFPDRRNGISGFVINNGVSGCIHLFWGSTFYVKTFDKNKTEESGWVKLADKTSSVVALDTPYHASNMQKLGILDSYHNYLTELHEYEKSQNVQSDSEIMNLNVLQPPTIPTEVEAYAKEYNLI